MNKVIKNINYFILLCLLLIPSLAFSQGSRYTGSYKKSAPIQYVNKSNIVIEGIEISNIALYNCSNITIKNSKFGPTSKKAIHLENCSNIKITDCTFNEVQTGLLALKCTGNIKFEYNDVKNIQGEKGNESVQMVQFSKSTGSGNSVSYNVSDNISGQSSVEDHISMFNSHGTTNSPIMISGNWLRGGGPSQSSGGIMLGDFGGSYIIAENNILVNPGQYGIAIAGGHNITIRNNKVYSKLQFFSNVGIYANNWTESINGKSYNNTIENNEINWTNREGKLHNLWIGNNMANVNGLETNKYNSKLNESILPKVIIGRAKNSGNNTPPITQPDNNTPNSPITEVYIDNFKRVAVKYLAFPIPLAHAEGYSSSGQLLVSMPLPRYNQAFPVSVPKGDYYIKITYPDLGKEEITKITIN